MDNGLKNLLPVLIGIHLVAVPLYGRIHPLIVTLILVLTAWSYMIISRRWKQPSGLIRILALIFSIFFLIFAYGSIFGQQPGTSLLLLLALMKIFEVRNKGDVSTIVFLSYFLIASNFFYTQSPATAIYALLVVLYLSSVLIYLNDTLGTIDLRQRLRSAGQFIFIAIPFMLILFVLFPRIPSPLWGLPKDTLSAKTGLAEELTLENISELVSSGEVAFRVVFEDEPPPNNQLYWRGPVLSHYDGETWRKNNAPETAEPDLVPAGDGVDFEYTVTLEPHNKNWLLALEHPTGELSDMRLSRELQLTSRNRVINVISYAMTSSPSARNEGLFEQEYVRNLQLPGNINPQSRQLAIDFYQLVDGDPEQIIELILEYFQEQDFFYTLSPPPLGQNMMDSFLFETRKGFCGHYASAFVTLTRAAGIPSRIVTGYQGGQVNPVDDYMIIRQSDAHAWAEVWLDGKGWVRIDPTSAVSPQRIESGIAEAGLEENRLPVIVISDNALFQRARYLIDSMHNSWNKWIIGYNKKRQSQLFSNIGIDEIDAGKLVLWLVIAMTVSGVILALIMLRHREPVVSDEALLYYRRFCDKLARAGLTRAHNEGEFEFLRRIEAEIPSVARSAEIITNSYLQIRYNEKRDERYLKNFIRAVKDFRVKNS